MGGCEGVCRVGGVRECRVGGCEGVCVEWAGVREYV